MSTRTIGFRHLAIQRASSTRLRLQRRKASASVQWVLPRAIDISAASSKIELVPEVPSISLRHSIPFAGRPQAISAAGRLE